MRRILSVVQKEFRQIRRTPAYFALIFVAPFIQLLVMGSALTTEVKNVPMTIVDDDRSPMSREIAGPPRRRPPSTTSGRRPRRRRRPPCSTTAGRG